MFPFWYFILFIIVFDSVNVRSHETTDKTQNGGKILLNGKREGTDLDEFGDSMLDPDTNFKFEDSQGGQPSSSQDSELQRSPETDEEPKDDNDDSSGDVDAKRPLQSGDIFSTAEMFPIALKLYKKARAKRRQGIKFRGIVSSAKKPEDLADKLFEAYFLTARRIVHLTENDLDGLDALQALAVDGEVVKMRTSGDSLTEKPEQTIHLNGQLVELDQRPKTCHYKLIYKKVSPSDSVLRKGKSGGNPPFNKISKLEKKMSPNRHLIINHKGRKSNKESNHLKTGVRANNNAANEQEMELVTKDGEQKKHKVSKKGKKKEPKLTENSKHLRNKHIDQNLPITTTPTPVCKWRYICRIPSDLDTCRLHTSCFDGKHNKPMLDNIYVDTERKKKNKEYELQVMNFRKTFGLTALDEQVEKILERHAYLVKPQNMRADNNIETLEQYFNNLIRMHQTSTLGINEANEADTVHPLNILVSDTTYQYWISTSTREDVRRAGGNVKMKSTPPSNIRVPQNFHVL